MSKNDMVMVPRDLMERYVSSVERHGYEFDGDQEIRAVLDASAEQHQDEPVALPERKPEIGTDPFANKGWNACLDEIAKLGPLYPAPADLGEVERLRAELEEWKERCRRNNDQAMEWMGKYDALRAQMSERDALLDRVVDHAKFWHDHPYAEVVEAIAKDYKAVSASAEPSAPACTHRFMSLADRPRRCADCDAVEPSAPAERDERVDLRAHLEAMCKLWPKDISDDGSGRMGFKLEVIEVVAKARAALERKP